MAMISYCNLLMVQAYGRELSNGHGNIQYQYFSFATIEYHFGQQMIVIIYILIVMGMKKIMVPLILNS